MSMPRGLEIVIILLVVLLIFGPKNLPKLGKMFGKTVKNVRDGMEGVDEEAPVVATQEVEQPAPQVSTPIQVTVPEEALDGAPEVVVEVAAPAAEASETDQPAQ